MNSLNFELYEFMVFCYDEDVNIHWKVFTKDFVHLLGIMDDDKNIQIIFIIYMILSLSLCP